MIEHLIDLFKILNSVLSYFTPHFFQQDNFILKIKNGKEGVQLEECRRVQAAKNHDILEFMNDFNFLFWGLDNDQRRIWGNSGEWLIFYGP